jgi:Tfp pilus assembly protein PilO
LNRQELLGGDAFLDVVANLVGILIILVVLIGAQAATVWRQKERCADRTAEFDDLKSQTQKRWTEAQSLQSENAELREKINHEQQIINQLQANRQLVLTASELARRELEPRKENLDQKKQERVHALASIHDLRQQIQQVRYEFSALEQQLRPAVETINHYPTPIARTVFSDEVHFQISGGRIAYVPMYELVEAMKNEWRVKAQKLQSTGSTWETVGPIGQFRLQYKLEAVADDSLSDRRAIEFRQFALQPVGSLVGEESLRALEEGSEFRTVLARAIPSKTTVSLWVYPDGYDDLSLVRKWLREHGYQTACWPLDRDWQISGGPNGFRTTTN